MTTNPKNDNELERLLGEGNQINSDPSEYNVAQNAEMPEIKKANPFQVDKRPTSEEAKLRKKRISKFERKSKIFTYVALFLTVIGAITAAIVVLIIRR